MNFDIGEEFGLHDAYCTGKRRPFYVAPSYPLATSPSPRPRRPYSYYHPFTLPLHCVALLLRGRRIQRRPAEHFHRYCDDVSLQQQCGAAPPPRGGGEGAGGRRKGSRVTPVTLPVASSRN